MSVAWMRCALGLPTGKELMNIHRDNSGPIFRSDNVDLRHVDRHGGGAVQSYRGRAIVIGSHKGLRRPHDSRTEATRIAPRDWEEELHQSNNPSRASTCVIPGLHTTLGPSYTCDPNPVVLTPWTRQRIHNILGLEGGCDVARAPNTCQPWGRCPSRDATNLGGSLLTPAFSPFMGRREPAFPHPRAILEFTQRPWANSTPVESKDPNSDPKAFKGLTNQPPYPDRNNAATKGQPPMTRSANDLPHFPRESDKAPLGGVARCPMPTPSASVCSLSDLDTLSSDSTDSLREQLRLVNQRIDDVRKTLRTKDECGESPLSNNNIPHRDERANQYIIAEILVVEKREDQKRSRVEPSRGPPPGLPSKRIERAEQIVPRPPSIPLNSTRTEIFL
ncbi:hypothetical protein BHE74_00024111 [Ensete ventricosum]|nr:hypothetical protein GW17_00028765 [Ensete ventricosum]RWW68360.1 hypothetical protein BHE74_00024111 [Ensete ventricosum]